jgi:hypothetical protein
MATFEIGDWVQITPTPDEKWEHWTKEHTAMTSMIGEILEKDIAQHDSSIKFVRIMVYDENNDPLKQEWFLERQIILSTRYDKVLADERDRACEELQKWEKKKKDMVDDSLKKAFGLIPLVAEPKKKSKKKDSTSTLKVEAPIEEVWEGPTDEIDQRTIDEVLDILDEFEYDDIVNGTAD